MQLVDSYCNQGGCHMRDFLQEVSFTINQEPFLVFGSQMSSGMGQKARQGQSTANAGDRDGLDFSQLLMQESRRIAGM